jgi:hypothetical protein
MKRAGIQIAKERNVRTVPPINASALTTCRKLKCFRSSNRAKSRAELSVSFQQIVHPAQAEDAAAVETTSTVLGRAEGTSIRMPA